MLFKVAKKHVEQPQAKTSRKKRQHHETKDVAGSEPFELSELYMPSACAIALLLVVYLIRKCFAENVDVTDMYNFNEDI